MKSFVVSCIMAFGLLLPGFVHAQTYVATEDQNSQVVNMAVGDTLDVMLKSNPSTGYSWSVTSPVAHWLVLAETSYNSTSSRPGASGIALFRFVAISPGECQLTMAYARSWEKDIPPVETYELVAHIEQI